MTREMRKFVLLIHVISSVSWIGVDLVMAVLSFRGLTSEDPQTVATAYGALTMFCVPLLLTLGLLSLATGVTLGLGTRFGLVRYWWVATKLVISLVLTTLVLVALRPTLGDAGDRDRDHRRLPARPAVGGQDEHDLPADRLDQSPAVRGLAVGVQALGSHPLRPALPARPRTGPRSGQSLRMRA